MENTENTNNNGLMIVPKLAQLDHITFAKDLGDSIKEGLVDPLMAHIFLKRIEKIQDILKEDKEVKELINKEAAKHNVDGKTFSFMGANLLLGAVHTSYDFTGCNDPVWTNLNEIFETVKELKANREKMLKAAFPDKPGLGFSSPTIVVDKLLSLVEMDCGEEYRLNAPIKKQVEGVKVTFKK